MDIQHPRSGQTYFTCHGGRFIPKSCWNRGIFEGFNNLNMKLLLLLLLQGVICITSTAQIKVFVSSSSEHLPYAHVYINSKPIGTTDSIGTIVIPESKLLSGDTISASFLGYHEGLVIFNPKEKNEYKINLHSTFTIESALIKACNYKFMRKHVAELIFDNLNKVFEMNFEITKTGNIPCRGIIKLIYHPRLDIDYRYKCLSIQTDCDTSQSITMVADIFRIAIHNSSYLFWNRFKGAFISYQGINNNEKIFNYSYKNENENERVIHSLIFADMDNKQIKRLQMESANNDQEIWTYDIFFINNKGRSYINDCEFKRDSLQIRLTNIRESLIKNSYVFFPSNDKD